LHWNQGDEDLHVSAAPREPLRTSTGEPFQPVRLYYDIPSKSYAAKRLKQLRCVVKDGACWVWLYQDEATSLTFDRSYATLSRELHPILIGRIRVPRPTSMVVELRSAPRAIEGARFFQAALGPDVVLRRLRVINRFFDVSELSAGLARLDKILDQDVTVIDPRVTEQEMQAALASSRTQDDKIDAYVRYMESKRADDIPLVEDFPLPGEEEISDFRDLGLPLRMRMLRALDHFQGGRRTLREVMEKHLAAALPGAGFTAEDLRRYLWALTGFAGCKA